MRWGCLALKDIAHYQRLDYSYWTPSRPMNPCDRCRKLDPCDQLRSAEIDNGRVLPVLGALERHKRGRKPSATRL